jgi:hypothetical protein
MPKAKKPAKKMGRPSSYNPDFCEMAVEFLRDGYSVTALAGHLKCARSSVFKWAEEHKEFSDALKTGQALAALWWEKRLREVARTGVGSASAAIFGVKNRSRAEWKDRHDITLNDMPAPMQEFLAMGKAGEPGWNTGKDTEDPEPQEDA